AARRAGLHGEQVDVLADLGDRVLDPERVTADNDDLRQVILVHERDARLRAAVAGDEPDEARNEERIRDQDAEQDRRADQHAQVLAKEQRRALHENTSSACSSSYSAVGPTNVTVPCCKIATRSA